MVNILLITQHFPPENSGGIGRPYSLYKYLPKNGVNVFVVTVDSYGTLENETNVCRCGSFINWRKSPVISLKRVLKCASLLLRPISNHVDLYWYYNAKRKIDQIISHNNIHLIYSTFPSIESIQLGYISSIKNKKPFIVEFRDGLVFESIYRNQNWFKEQERKITERRVVEASKVVITIGHNLSKYFQATYPNSRIETVFNGYDKDDFLNVKTILNSQKIKIAIFGSLNQSRKANRDNLFKVLRQLYNETLISKINFELTLIGCYSELEKKNILSYGIRDCVSFKDMMPKKEGLAYVKSYFNYVLFYGTPNETTVISSKLLEYLYLGLPIIGICKGNEAGDIIKQTGTGEVCDFDFDSVKSILKKALKREIVYTPKHDEIVKFDREYQAWQISHVIRKSLEM